jgi:hypothetical protein
MSKGIELGESQIESLMNGSTSLIVPISDTEDGRYTFLDYTNEHEHKSTMVDAFIKSYSSLQAGDKEVFVKEEFTKAYGSYNVEYKLNSNATVLYWQPASEMTKEQSRFSIDIEDVRIIRIQDFGFDEVYGLSVTEDSWRAYSINSPSFVEWFDNIMEQYEEIHFKETAERITLGRYEDNPYVFLYDAKVTTK